MKYQAITAVVILICCFNSTQCQVTIDNNIPGAFNYVGFDGNSTIPLPIQNIGDPRISISSNGNEKMNFNELATWNGINGMTANNVSRVHLGLTGNVQNPFSLLHIGQQTGGQLYRPWMNVGLTMGASADFMHIGILERARPTGNPAQADAVIAWGCNDDIFVPEQGPDNLRFLFLTPTNAFPPVGGGPADGREQQGRETMRITPMGNVGIGDFSHMPNGLDEQPTQRLDVDGTARLRLMPSDSLDVIITGVYAEDDPEVDGDYILNYSTIEDFTSTLEIGCDWEVVNASDVATGFTGACREGQVLVGTDNQTGTNAKVFMTKDYTGTTLRSEAMAGNEFTDQIAGYFIAKGGLVNYGLKSIASSALGASFGVRGEATSSTLTYGVSGYASKASQVNYGVNGIASGGFGENPPVNNVGVYGRALGNASILNFGGYFVACDGAKNIGLYAEGCGASGTAAHFAGGIVTLGGVLSLSDESIKNDIIDIESAIDKISQLQPKQYNFNTVDYPHLYLKSELSYGFSAQEMQEVLPELLLPQYSLG